MCPEKLHPEVKEAKEISPAEILYLSGEIPSPQDMLEHFLQTKLGRISGKYEVVPVLTAFPSPPQTEGVLSLSRRENPLEHWRALIPQVTEKLRLSKGSERTLRRTANYLSQCQLQKGKSLPLERLTKVGASFYLYQKLVESSVRHYENPSEALEAGQQFLSSLICGEVDPFSFRKDSWNQDEELTRFALIDTCRQTLNNEIALCRDYVKTGPAISFKIPILQQGERHQTGERGKSDIESWQTLERKLNILRLLEKNRVRVTIVGPANSGKSTLTASLLTEIEDLIYQAAHNHLDFADLRLTCGFTDLDPQSHDVENILYQRGSSDRTKIPWTNQLALKTAVQFIGATKNIIVADAPGGSPDKITETVVGPTDLTILLIAAEDDESWLHLHKQWREGLKGISQTPVAILRSRRPGQISRSNELLESMITSFRWDREDIFFKDLQHIDRAGGRVVGLNRKVLENDPCISTLARLVLFDFLPQAVIARKKQTIIYLSQLRDQQSLAKPLFEQSQKK